MPNYSLCQKFLCPKKDFPEYSLQFPQCRAMPANGRCPCQECKLKWVPPSTRRDHARQLATGERKRWEGNNLSLPECGPDVSAPPDERPADSGPDVNARADAAPGGGADPRISPEGMYCVEMIEQVARTRLTIQGA